MSDPTTNPADVLADGRATNERLLTPLMTLATMAWGCWLMYVGVRQDSFRVRLVATGLLLIGLVMAVVIAARARARRPPPPPVQLGFDVIQNGPPRDHDGAPHPVERPTEN